ncbi:39S ribosomal protein L30, mitochondrial [Protopterus annectens]|uniref:39S ribosomal protein L30, mitochondrial n=1 Tax=Protopterus annectens TaxID=7888 RepID=UPI001CFB6604|nr:39S ribosomal protein L30, mitochondrial [Protopterus annectens]XP_043928111.1 39S ribosomal protein L30, mitochondrial [Protopterus annectens]
MAVLCQSACRSTVALKSLAQDLLTQSPWMGFFRFKFTKARIPAKAFEPRPEDHETYGGNPEEPHKLHLVTRIKSVKGRPYWEKKIVNDLDLGKAHHPRVHKNIPTVNARLRIVKHLIRVQPLKLPQCLPNEEEYANTFLKSTGELVVYQKLKPVEQKAIES